MLTTKVELTRTQKAILTFSLYVNRAEANFIQICIAVGLTFISKDKPELVIGLCEIKYIYIKENNTKETYAGRISAFKVKKSQPADVMIEFHVCSLNITERIQGIFTFIC